MEDTYADASPAEPETALADPSYPLPDTRARGMNTKSGSSRESKPGMKQRLPGLLRNICRAALKTIPRYLIITNG